MKLRLNYIVPNQDTVIDACINTEMEGFTDWLHYMVRDNPDTNFFFVVDSTDIFDDDEEPSTKTEEKYWTAVFDEENVNWTPDPVANLLFLKGIEQHMNTVLEMRGHVLLNDVFDALRMPRSCQGAVVGWLRDVDDKDQYISFGLPDEGLDVRTLLEFNVDGRVVEKI